jgi:hypothetical protein
MRVFSRIALVVLVGIFSALPLSADHFTAECQLSLVSTNEPETGFGLSPHGVFRYGSQVFALRGQTLTTYAITDLGDMSVAREDFIGSLGAHESNGGVVFGGGYLYLSTQAGLEIYDLRGVRADGSAPVLVSRTPGLHYRRLALNGSLLAGVYPATDYPCYTNGTSYCHNEIHLISVANMNNPSRVGTISTLSSGLFQGFNDVAFNHNFLVATGVVGTYIFNVSNPSNPSLVTLSNSPGTFLVSNTSNLLGIGNEGSIEVWTLSSLGTFARQAIYTLPALTVDRTNPIMFHPQAWFDDQNGRLITMIDEKDPHTLQPARTIAFDVFDFTVPMWEGSDPRGYEAVSYITPDEVKYNPIAVGPYVYTIGSMSGLQTWGACGQMSGRIEWESSSTMNCGGADIHGWVTGTQKIVNVELFLDSGALGAASLLNTYPRNDVPSRTPVTTWRVNVNLDQQVRGDYTLRAVGTDSLGNRRQFASKRVFFPGPGQNCTARRRTAR